MTQDSQILIQSDGVPKWVSLSELAKLLGKTIDAPDEPATPVDPQPELPPVVKPDPVVIPNAGEPRTETGLRAGNKVYDCIIDGVPRRIEVLSNWANDAFLVRGGNFKFDIKPGVKLAAIPDTLDSGFRFPSDFRLPKGYRWRKFNDGAWYVDKSTGDNEGIPPWIGNSNTVVTANLVAGPHYA